LLRLLMGFILGSSKSRKGPTLKRRSSKIKKQKPIIDTRIKILLPLVFILIILNLGLEEGGILGAGTVKEVNVLVYNGPGADSNSVLQIENSLNQSNTQNFISGVKFEVKTADTINADTLSHFDVLIMPGGTDTSYLKNERVDGTAIKNFVAGGKGYVGICAGAYSGAEHIEGWYEGWGVAPHVNSQPSLTKENLTVQFTAEGQRILGQKGTQTISHINGPALYSSNAYVVVFAIYADNSTGYQNYAAIVGDYYGQGRSVLSGVHPELTPQNPELLAELTAWAADV
jgi:glutamine amidotransferase-like uncharacterized protein